MQAGTLYQNRFRRSDDQCAAIYNRAVKGAPEKLSPELKEIARKPVRARWEKKRREEESS